MSDAHTGCAAAIQELKTQRTAALDRCAELAARLARLAAEKEEIEEVDDAAGP